jgi:hypothetical protein
LEYLRGSFPLRESDYFFFQNSSLFFKFHSLILVKSFKVLKFCLQLWNKSAILMIGTVCQHTHRNAFWLNNIITPIFHTQVKPYIWNCLDFFNFKCVKWKQNVWNKCNKNYSLEQNSTFC